MRKAPSKKALSAFIILFVTLFVLFGGFRILSNGISIDSLRFADIQVRGLYLKLNNKFILEIKEIDLIKAMSKSSSKQSAKPSAALDFQQINDYVKYALWGLAYFENLRIERIILSDEHVASVIYDGAHYSLSFPKLQATFDVQNEKNAIGLDIKRLRLLDPDIEIAGKIIYSNTNKQASFGLSISPMDSALVNALGADGFLDSMDSGAEPMESISSVKDTKAQSTKISSSNTPAPKLFVQGSSDFKRLLLRAKGSQITDLGFVRELITEHASALLPTLDTWLFNALEFKHLTLEHASFDITLSEKRFVKTLLENTNLTLTIQSPAYKLHPSLAPFSAQHAKIQVQKAQAMLELEKPALESIDLQGSSLAFSFVDSVPTLSILAHSGALRYTQALQDLLGFYGVKLPIERIMADMKADLAITIPFAQDIHVGFDGRLNADNAVLRAGGLDFTSKSASVAININPKTNTNAIEVWTQNLAYENLFDIDTKTHLNLAEKKLHTSLFVHSLRVSTNPDINQKLIKQPHSTEFNPKSSVDSAGDSGLDSAPKPDTSKSSVPESSTPNTPSTKESAKPSQSAHQNPPIQHYAKHPTSREQELGKALIQVFARDLVGGDFADSLEVRTYKPLPTHLAPSDIRQLASMQPFAKPGMLTELAHLVQISNALASDTANSRAHDTTSIPESISTDSSTSATNPPAPQSTEPGATQQVINLEEILEAPPLHSPNHPESSKPHLPNTPVSKSPALDSPSLESPASTPAPSTPAPSEPQVHSPQVKAPTPPESSPDPATQATATNPTNQDADSTDSTSPESNAPRTPSEPITPLEKPDISLAPTEQTLDLTDSTQAPESTQIDPKDEQADPKQPQEDEREDEINDTQATLDSTPSTTQDTMQSNTPESAPEKKTHRANGVELDFTRPMSEQEKLEKIIALLKYQDEQKFTYDIFKATQDNLPQIDVDVDFSQNPMRISIPALDVYMQIFENEIQANILNFAKFAPFSPLMQYLGLSSGNANIALKGARDIDFKVQINDYPSFLLTKDKKIVKDFVFRGEYADNKLQVRSDDELIRLDLYDNTTLARFKDLDVSIDGLLESKIPAIQEIFSTSSEKKAVFTSDEILFESEFLRAKRRYERTHNIKPKIIAIEAQNVTGFFKEVTIPLDDFNAKIRDDRISADATYKNGIANIDIIHGNTIFKAGNFSGEFLNRVIGRQIVDGGLFELSGIYKNDIFNGDIKIQSTSFKGFAIVQNVIGLIDTIPSLVMFRSPGLSSKGYEVKSGTIKLSLNTQYVGLESIHLIGKSMDIEGNGLIELDTQEVDMGLSISTLKNLSGILNKIPIVGYLLLGKDGKVTTQVSLRGTLQDPKTQISLAQDILKTPLNVIKRAFKPVDLVIDEIIKSIEQ